MTKLWDGLAINGDLAARVLYDDPLQHGADGLETIGYHDRACNHHSHVGQFSGQRARQAEEERRPKPATTTKIYDIGDSIIMGLDVLGLITELKSPLDQRVTIGGRAEARYRKYINGFVPDDYETGLHPALRTKKYFRENGLEVAPSNVYAAGVATPFSWVFLPIVQPINGVSYLYNCIRNCIRNWKQAAKR